MQGMKQMIDQLSSHAQMIDKKVDGLYTNIDENSKSQKDIMLAVQEKNKPKSQVKPPE